MYESDDTTPNKHKHFVKHTKQQWSNQATGYHILLLRCIQKEDDVLQASVLVVRVLIV